MASSMDSSISLNSDSLASLPLPEIAVTRPAAPEAALPAMADVRVALPQPRLGWAILWTLGLYLALAMTFVVWIAVGTVIVYSNGPSTTEQATQLANEFGSSYATAIMVSVLATSCAFSLLVAAIGFGRAAPAKLSLRRCTRTQALLAVVMSFPLALIVAELANVLAALMLSPGTSAAVSGPQTSFLVTFLAVCVLPAIGEEVFFRGILSRGLIARYGIVLGSILTTALFALVHDWPVQMLAIPLMGLAMQLMFLATRSLPASMLFHLTYNTVVITRGYWAESLPVPASPLMLVTSAAALAACGVILYQTRTQWVLPNGQPWSPGYFATEMPPKELQAVAYNGRASLAAKLAATTTLSAFATAVVTAMV